MDSPDRVPSADALQSVDRLEFTVDWQPGHAASYLIPGDEPVLVDAGTPGTAGCTELYSGLADVGYRPEDVDHVLLTHAHTDHVGQTRMILESGDATVYAPRHVKDRYQRDVETIAAATRANLLEAGVDPELVDVSSDHLIEVERIIRESLPLDAVDVWIEHGEPVSVGPHRVEPIYSPGHHVTHFCYRTTLGGERVLFSGDMAIEPFRAAALLVNFDDGVRESVTAFLDSLERLGTYEADRVFPGHGPVHTTFDTVVERSVSDLEAKLDVCLDALDPRGSTAFQVATERAGRTNNIERLLAEIVGMLSVLESRGAVRSSLDDGVRFYEPR